MYAAHYWLYQNSSDEELCKNAVNKFMPQMNINGELIINQSDISEIIKFIFDELHRVDYNGIYAVNYIYYNDLIGGQNRYEDSLNEFQQRLTPYIINTILSEFRKLNKIIHNLTISEYSNNIYTEELMINQIPYLEDVKINCNTTFNKSLHNTNIINLELQCNKVHLPVIPGLISLIINADTVTGLSNNLSLERLTLINIKNINLCDLEKCTKLKELIINNVSIDVFPKLNKLHKLRKLVINNTDLKTLSDQDNINACISYLDLANNKLTNIDAVKFKQNLKYLDIRNNNIKEIPHYIGKNIVTMKANAPTNTIPDTLIMCESLRELELTNCNTCGGIQISFTNRNYSMLASGINVTLEKLNLDNSLSDTLTFPVNKFHGLIELDLSNSKNIDKYLDFNKFPKLEILKLNYSSIKRIPPGLSMKLSLKELHVKGEKNITGVIDMINKGKSVYKF